ncbi:type I glutamate--ammonia ligase [Patescibacteria group bacterium]|nr:type I glutamate--ammonia ligase [Patescibacteria group bacterium]
MPTKTQILSEVKKHEIEYVNLHFTDIHGMVKSITIPVSELESAIENNVWFDGSSIEGFTRIFESDMYLKLDLDTFRVLPWGSTPTALFICDVYLPDGSPFLGDPRQILKKQLAVAEKMGFQFNTGPELEFFLFKKKEDGSISSLPNDKAGYFDFTTDLAAHIRKDMSSALLALGINVETLHHECAPGQHEISFRYADALHTADSAVMFKCALKAIAQQHDLYATFMPKPIQGQNGSGMHTHISLADLKTGKNLFYSPKDEYGLSELGRHFVAGLLEHASAFTAITNPTVNSYKRLVPGYEAPVYIAWGTTNRSALIRLPRVNPKLAPKATRVELRNPDPSCNPYLAFAAMLASGLDGIRQKKKAPTPVNENIFEFNDAQAKKYKIRTLPPNLRKAIRNFAKDNLLTEAFGPHFCEKYISAKQAEYDEFRLYVSPWELQRYLEY